MDRVSEALARVDWNTTSLCDSCTTPNREYWALLQCAHVQCNTCLVGTRQGYKCSVCGLGGQIAKRLGGIRDTVALAK